MAKINYPTEEFIDRWIDNFLDSHPDTKVSDFQELKEQAEDAWWLNEIEHDRPTPFDLTEEQEKASKEARKGMAKSDKERKPRTVTRKADAEKRKIVEIIAKCLTDNGFSTIVTNVERQIDFGEYSLTLTKHRPKKGQ